MTSRREVLRTFGSIAALPFMETMAPEEIVAIVRLVRARAERQSLLVLTPAQYAIVAQAAERVIPRTATPGATDARVADFIDVMLSDWYSPSERERFTAGLTDLDARARHLAGRSFVQTPERQQAQLLETLDAEVQQIRQSSPAAADAHWFAMLKHLTVWGYYTSRPGIVEELRVQLMPGRYDGNAKY